MVTSAMVEEYCAKAFECEERARNETLYVLKLHYHELAQQWRSLAVQLERLDAEQAGKRQ